MARLHTSGGEIRDHSTTDIGSPDGFTAGTVATTTDTTDYRSGSASTKCTPGAAGTCFRRWPVTAPSAGTSLYKRAYIWFDTLPTNTVRIMRIGTTQFSMRLKTTGKIGLYNDTTGTQIGSDSTMTLATNTKYRVELKSTIGVGAVDAAELRVQLDGAESVNPVETVASTSGISVTDTQPTSVDVGVIDAPGNVLNLRFDDTGLNDSTGTKQNTWCGHARVLLSKASRRDAHSLWGTCSGDGPATPGDVSNTPPAGHAGVNIAGHSTHQATSAGTTGTANVVYACQDYASAGVAGNAFWDKLGAATLSNAGHIGRPYSMTGGGPRLAQSFKINGALHRLDVPLFRVGSPTDDVVIELQGDAAGLPDGTVLESITITGPGISNSAWDWRTFDIAIRVMATTTTLWLVARRTGANDDTNYFGWAWGGSGGTGTYEGGVSKIYDGAVWQNGLADHGFRAHTTEGAITLSVITPALCHGEEVSTGTKTGTFALTKNPVIAAATFTYGNDIGAAGAYPTNWRWRTIGPAYDVNFSSAGPGPWLEFKKTDTGSRYVLVCFAGVYVEVRQLDPG